MRFIGPRSLSPVHPEKGSSAGAWHSRRRTWNWPHLGSSAELRFSAVKPPEHRVAVAVTESEVATPVEAGEIALGPYRAATDKTGVAHIEVPGGIYDLAVGSQVSSRPPEPSRLRRT